MEKQGVLLTPPATAMNGQGKPVPEEFKGMQVRGGPFGHSFPFYLIPPLKILHVNHDIRLKEGRALFTDSVSSFFCDLGRMNTKRKDRRGSSPTESRLGGQENADRYFKMGQFLWVIPLFFFPVNQLSIHYVLQSWWVVQISRGPWLCCSKLRQIIRN